MSSCCSPKDKFSLEQLIFDLEKEVEKYENALSDEAKHRLDALRKSAPDLIRVKENVIKAKEAVGLSKSTVDKNEYRTAMVECLRTLQSLKKRRDKLRKERDEAWSKAAEARKKKDDAATKTHLTTFKNCKNKIDQLDGAVGRVSSSINSLEISELSTQVMDSIKKVEAAMASIVAQIDSLNPEELEEKFVEFNDYINEIDGLTVASNAREEDNMDDLLSQLDNDLAADQMVVNDLPEPPASILPRETVEMSNSAHEKVAELS